MKASANSQLHIETVVLERSYRATPARIFAAWHDVEARKRWSVPSPDVAIVYDKADFRVGGFDDSRCGTPGDMRFRAVVLYLEITQDRRIIFAEHVTEGGVARAASLITVDLTPNGNETQLTLTMQISSIDGPDMLQGYRDGWTPTLENLAREVE
jgi:uncharacterized protein YndB with AHSA1/START domain